MNDAWCRYFFLSFISPCAPSTNSYPQLNIANPINGAMKTVEVDDEKRLVQFYEKRMSQEIEGDFLGDDYKGYVFR